MKGLEGGRAGLEVGVKEKWEKENLRRKMVKKCTGMCEVNCSGRAGGTGVPPVVDVFFIMA